tara:strand:+ start:16254 stop:17903 length:1650 start_codon:yes stop_codon:yes gene_type:complete
MSVEDSQKTWSELASSSLLLKAVASWRVDPQEWLESAFDRLPETVRVNPLRQDSEWVEQWLKSVGADRIGWFKGPGSAWEMPFARGSAEGEVRELLKSLHETGRITRQEVVSMIPVLAMDISPGETVLDMCASPGSKTTQIAECLGDRGIVFANEISNSRANTLVSNVQRHASRSTIVINHDGRHIPKVPMEGFDKILVDVPCTGSATTRKNPEVWGKWSPKGGRSLHDLQINLLRKAVSLVRPGGVIVYSTCSLDPIENEAVVAEIMRTEKNLELLQVSEILPNLPGRGGFSSWPDIDDDAMPSDSLDLKKSMASPVEDEISESLKKCMRIWHDDIGGSGFFVSVIKNSGNLPIMTQKPEFYKSPEEVKPDIQSSPRPISRQILNSLNDRWGNMPDNLWMRGKKILWANSQAEEIWSSERRVRNGRTSIPGKRWRPLNVLHLGREIARVRKGQPERISGKATLELSSLISKGITEVTEDTIDSILHSQSLELEETGISENIRGGHIIMSDTEAVPVWVGGKVTIMLNEKEILIKKKQRNLEILSEDKS